MLKTRLKNVFIVGEQRSGSNLLRLMLDQSVSLACPHPPHFLQRLKPLETLYEKLPASRRVLWIANDMLDLANVNPIPWKGFDPNPKEIAKAAVTNNLTGIYIGLMNLLAKNRKAEGWVCKSMQNIRWIDDILNASPQAIFVHLARDPRDVTASFKNAVIGNKHPYCIAKQWSELNALCLAAARRSPNKFHKVRYEDLVCDPERTLIDLCAFIGIEFQSSMLQFHKSKEAVIAARASQLWENLNKSLISKPEKPYLTSLIEPDIRLVERVSHKEMYELGYSPEFSRGKFRNFTEDEIQDYQAWNDAESAKAFAEANHEDRSNRLRQSKVLSMIRTRLQNPRVAAIAF